MNTTLWPIGGWTLGWSGCCPSIPSAPCPPARAEAGGDRHALGDLDELCEAVDRVEAYRVFQPDRFDRRALNPHLRALAQDREVRP